MFTKKLIVYSQKLIDPISNLRMLKINNYPVVKKNITTCMPVRVQAKLYGTQSIQESRKESNVVEYRNIDKAKIISLLNFVTEEDALPFYELPTTTLLQIYHATRDDVKKRHCKNRLYYIANKIKCQPSDLSKYLVKQTFIYNMPFDRLEKKLSLLLEMNVPGEQILRDLHVLENKVEFIEMKIQMFKNKGLDTLNTWVFRCNEDTLNRFVQIRLESKQILGDLPSITYYLAQRLNTTLENIETMCMRNPTLRSTRPSKVKKFLDYLEKEGFSHEAIINKPLIFNHSLDTVKQRIETLRELDVKAINLKDLCKGRVDFDKYCKAVKYINEKK